jgi:hypothetical protein
MCSAHSIPRSADRRNSARGRCLPCEHHRQTTRQQLPKEKSKATSNKQLTNAPLPWSHDTLARTAKQERSTRIPRAGIPTPAGWGSEAE